MLNIEDGDKDRDNKLMSFRIVRSFTPQCLRDI